MLARERGAKRCNSVSDPCFVKGDDIGVSLAHNSDAGRGHRGFRLIYSIEDLRFMENGCFLRVEIFRLPVAHDAPTERDALAAYVVDGKHHTFIEPVAILAATAHDHIGLHHLIGFEAKREKMVEQVIPTGRIAEIPFLRDITAEFSAREIPPRLIGSF